jgi:hypothetical protein
LESRSVPASLYWPGNGIAAQEPDDTLDAANKLGNLAIVAPAEVVGEIGNGAHADADVDWFQFSLDAPSVVNICVSAEAGSSFSSVVSLYSTAESSDPQNPFGFRLIEQKQAGSDGVNHLVRPLPPGTYHVAVSGAGNHYFHPYLAGSGYAGSTGAYSLQMTAATWGTGLEIGPAVLTTDPAPGSSHPGSLAAIRVSFTTALDTSTVQPGESVLLSYSQTGVFGNNDQYVSLSAATFSPLTNELLLLPGTALAPGFYRLVLKGDSAHGEGAYLTDLFGNPLGKTAENPSGEDFIAAFSITGIEGRDGATTADDTVSTARFLGSLENAGIQVVGKIGDDPTDPIPNNPADVDLYHFRITGQGRYAFTAEAFAGRIGSPLNPGLSLFKMVNGQLHLVTANNDSQNTAVSSNGMLPLYGEPVLFAGLEAGDYYIAVSSWPNVPDPNNAGAHGIFDPLRSHSGRLSDGTTGSYVLNLAAVPDNQAPTVTWSTLVDGTTLTQPPTHFTLTFSEGVNLQALAFLSYAGHLGEPRAVYVEGADGSRYTPRLVGYDSTTNTAQFLMLEGLMNGAYRLHLSGREGLADLAGNVLVGNDPAGDYVIDFSVAGPVRGTNGDPHDWANQEPNDTLETCQEMGVFFPRELEAGVTISREQEPASSDTADYFAFEVLQTQTYLFNLIDTALPSETNLALFDNEGNLLGAARANQALHRMLQPGVYRLGIAGWSADEAPAVSYQLRISMLGQFEWPPSLTTGAAPAIRIRLATELPPANSPEPPTGGNTVSPPQVVAPSTGSTVSPISPRVISGDAPASSFPSVYIPPTLLSGMGSGPLGGVGSNGNGTMTAGLLAIPPDQVVVRSPNSLLLDSLVRMTVLTPAGPYSAYSGAEGVEMPGSVELESAMASPDLIQTLIDSWQNTLDALFGAGEWLNSVPLWTTTESQSLPDTIDAKELRNEETVPLDAVWVDDVVAPGLTETMVTALASAGMLAILHTRPRRKQRRKTKATMCCR